LEVAPSKISCAWLGLVRPDFSMGIMQELNEVSEHIFKCPKCGGTEVEVELRTKLHLLCFRCDHKWSEQTLDKRDTKYGLGPLISKKDAEGVKKEDAEAGDFDVTAQTKEEKEEADPTIWKQMSKIAEKIGPKGGK